jgi:hypothetical protein
LGARGRVIPGIFDGKRNRLSILFDAGIHVERVGVDGFRLPQMGPLSICFVPQAIVRGIPPPDESEERDIDALPLEASN